MTKQLKPIIHGRDHSPDGADPLRGAPTGSYRDQVLSEPTLWAFWPLDDASGDFQELVADRDLTAVESVGGPPDFALAYGLAGPFDDGVTSTGFTGKDSGIVNTLGTYGWDVPDLDEVFATGPFTVELWAYPITPVVPTQGGPPDFYGYLASASTSTDFLWYLRLWADGELQVGDTEIGTPWLTSTLAVDEWSHITFTFDGTTGRLYVNGALADSGAASPAGTSGNFYIGRQAPTGSAGVYAGYFEGRLANVALYTAALDAATVSSHSGGPAGDGEGTVLQTDADGNTVWAKVGTGNLADGAVTPPKIEPGGDGETLQTIGGNTVWAPAAGGDPADDTLVWMPLTTVSGGTPELVWDADDSLIPTLTLLA
jgi:concanavalin A-like lectin/glucanase superfamily protein